MVVWRGLNMVQWKVSGIMQGGKGYLAKVGSDDEYKKAYVI
jgi:hypothetical protein